MRWLSLSLQSLLTYATYQYDEMKTSRGLYTDATRSFNYSRVTRRYDPEGKRLDFFANSVAVQPGVALVGVPDDDDNEYLEQAGSVFIYIEDSDTRDWRLIRKIEDGEPGDQFGWAVALNTDLLAVVGAWRGNVYGDMSGAAYYFDVNPDPSGNQMAPVRFVPTERHGSAYFGCSVAVTTINGRVVAAIGAYNNRLKGAAFIYSRQSDGTFRQDQIVVGSDVETGDNFGYSVSLFGDILAVGSPMDNKQGSAYVFQYSGSYTQIDKLAQSFVDDDAHNPLYADAFGSCVVVGNGYIAVSSPNNDVRATDAGAVYIYTRADRRLEEDSEDSQSHRVLTAYSFSETLFARRPTSYFRFGYSLAADPVNDRLIVGSDVTHSNGQGAAYVYSMSPSTYFNFEHEVFPVQNPDDDTDENEEALFGASVAVYGDYLVVGAPLGDGEHTQSGDVYFYHAQTKKEYANMLKGTSSSSSSPSSEEQITAFEFIGMFLLVTVPLCFCITFLFFWRRYKSEGDPNEGFTTFVTEEVADILSAFSSKPSAMSGIGAAHFGDEESDESQHSSHPMVTSGSKSGGKTKLSSIKSSKKSPKKYSTASLDDSQEGL